MKLIDNLWTREEKQYLRRVYPYMKVEAIADIITRHTVGAIYAKAKAMKIRGNENHRSEADVIMQMRRAGLQMEEIADRLGYYRSTLYRRLKTYSNDYKKTNRA